MAPAVSDAASQQRRAGWLNSGARVLGTALSFVLLILLARTTTPEVFGAVAVILAWLGVAMALASFSMPLVVVRFAAEYVGAGRFDKARGVAAFAAASTLAIATGMASLGAAALGLGIVTVPQDFRHAGVAAAALLLPSVALLVVTGMIQGLKRVAAAEVLANVSRPVLLIVAVLAIGAFAGTPIAAAAILLAYLAVTVATLGACVAYAWMVAPVELKKARATYDARTWWRAAGAFTVVMIAAAVAERIDLLMLGATGTAAQVAAYAVAARFAQAIVMATNAVAAAMAPHFSECLADLHGTGRAEAQALVGQAARTALAVTVIAFVACAILGPLLPALFGAHYTGAYGPLVILAAGQALAALFGPAMLVATLAGAGRVAVGSLAAGIAVNVALNLALVPAHGANGAALATAAAYVCSAIAAWAWTRRRLALDSSVFSGRIRFA